MSTGWVGFDLDGTLVKGHKMDPIGPPIPVIVDLAKRMIAAGVEVRIFTARASGSKWHIRAVQDWCREHLGTVLDVTNVKDFDCLLIIDDRAISVMRNEGRLCTFAEMNDALAAAITGHGGG